MSKQVDAGLDTNVVVEIVTIADMNRDASTYLHVGTVKAEQKFDERVTQARGSLALAWHLHDQGKATLSLPKEVDRCLRELTPRGTHDWLHGMYFSQFLRPRVLSGWVMGAENDPVYDDAKVIGDAADRLLVQMAHDKRLVLVTRERNPLKALRAEATRLRVDCVSPEVYLQRQGVTVQDACSALLAAIDRAALVDGALSPFQAGDWESFRALLGYVLSQPTADTPGIANK